MLSSPPHPTAPAPSATGARRALPLIVLALAPLWLIGMFERGLWTPDEPREADICWRMSWQPDRLLPQLAGTPFLEKPPLTYWMSAQAISAFGDSPGAARAPNLLYAALTALAVGALALAMELGALPALIAALTAASALTAYRVAVWLAPDACLLAGCALALLGAWRGFRAPAGKPKLAGYALLHLGAALGFMAKSAPGWLVPALALLTLIAWERRWGELRRPELYARLALQALIIGPWVLAVADSSHGSEALRTLFWNNVVGRFTQVAAPAALDYTSGHHNTPGKYLLELPLYLLPWTLIVVAALARAWTRAREPGPPRMAWRFALAASIPFIIVLSLAATARDIYCAPALLGFGLLAGLWAADLERSSSRLDRLALLGTVVLIAIAALGLAVALVALAAAGAGSSGVCAAAAIAVVAIAAVGLSLAARAQRRAPQLGLAYCYAVYAAVLCVAARAAFPIVDRWQDLPALAAHIHSDTPGASLALLDPDETTVAMLDHGFAGSFSLLTSGGSGTAPVVHAWFASHGAAARVLVLLPGHASGPVTELLARTLGPTAAARDGVAGTLVDAGAASLARRYELPQGRRYALLAPPPPH